jgi:hypothetical protein
MGNWHCVPSGCASVNYREYVGGKVRWRYGTEPWQEISGADDYSSQSSYNLSANTSYKLVHQEAIVRNGLFQGWSGEVVPFSSRQFNGIQDWYVTFDKTLRQNGVTVQKYKTGYPPNDSFDYYEDGTFPPAGYRSIVSTIWVLSEGTWRAINFGSSIGMWFKRWQPANLSLATTQCQFKVFKKGQVVHSETRATCPQVEVIPCSLSAETKAIAIKKLPYLEKVEVVPYQYSAYKLPGVGAPIVQADKIPDQCLNIYNNAIYVIPPSGQGIYPNATPFDSFIAQICSAPGCPPPIYDVICDDCCQKCPDYTCPIECGDEICCYNDYGVSVQVIPKSNFCGGAS